MNSFASYHHGSHDGLEFKAGSETALNFYTFKKFLNCIWKCLEFSL